MKTKTAVQFRRMAKADLDAIEDIERNSFQWDRRWNDKHFLAAMREDHAFVALVSGEVAGYMIYRTTPELIKIDGLAVNTQFRRCGIGRSMLQLVTKRLSSTRPKAWIEVCEENLTAQLWLRACGWRCQEIVESAACEGDWYRFARGVE